MAKPRVTVTDRLANVIEVVELGRRSGLLSVERGAGAMLEEGDIYFVTGRAIFATLAGLRGREALAMLGQWGDCRFSFDPTAPRPAPNVSGGLGSNPAIGSVMAPQSSHRYQAPARPQPAPAPRPAYGQRPYESSPHGSNGANGAGRGAPVDNGANGMDRWGLPPGAPYIPGASGAPGAPGGSESGPLAAYPPPGADAQDPHYPYSDRRGHMPIGAAPQPHWSANGAPPAAPPFPAPTFARNAGGAMPGQYAPRDPRAPSVAPSAMSPAMSPAMTAHGARTQQLERRPRRAPDMRDLVAVISAHQLSRSHRAILLLANGEHTLPDLARLSARPVEEVATLVQELEEHGLVYYY